jgi:co-chaperonin GroES (HSP10)
MNPSVVVKKDGPLGFLTPQSQMAATDHPNRTKYWNGNKPPADLVRPLGALIAVQIVRDAGGRTTDAGIIIPETAEESWSTPLYVVVAVGPEAKWTKPGDIIGVAGRVEFVVIRVDGWEVLVLHEQQASVTLPGKRAKIYDE